MSGRGKMGNNLLNSKVTSLDGLRRYINGIKFTRADNGQIYVPFARKQDAERFTQNLDNFYSGKIGRRENKPSLFTRLSSYFNNDYDFKPLLPKEPLNDILSDLITPTTQLTDTAEHTPYTIGRSNLVVTIKESVVIDLVSKLGAGGKNGSLTAINTRINTSEDDIANQTSLPNDQGDNADKTIIIDTTPRTGHGPIGVTVKKGASRPSHQVNPDKEYQSGKKINSYLQPPRDREVY